VHFIVKSVVPYCPNFHLRTIIGHAMLRSISVRFRAKSSAIGSILDQPFILHTRRATEIVDWTSGLGERLPRSVAALKSGGTLTNCL
jgi:hypothetical protein